MGRLFFFLGVGRVCWWFGVFCRVRGGGMVEIFFKGVGVIWRDECGRVGVLFYGVRSLGVLVGESFGFRFVVRNRVGSY